jgi:hypothetical protein
MRTLPLALLLALTVAGTAAAQERYSFTASLAGGLAGSFDADPDPGFGNLSYQAGFSWLTRPNNRVAVRLGRMDFSDEQMERWYDATLDYVNIGGEYRFSEGYYQSGIYLALGGYFLDGEPTVPDEESSRSALGLALGVTGDFEVSDRFSIIVELAGHWADLPGAQMFANGLVGVAYQF